MRGSEIEDLPPGWVLVPLGEVAEVQLGKMLSQKARTGRGARPYLRNVNVRWHHFDLSDLLVMDFSHREVAKYELREGDLLVCEGGEPGRAAVWRGQIPGIMYQKALHRVRPRHHALNPQFLAYQLEYDAGNGRLSTYFTGSTIKHLPREALLAYSIRLPPRGEQDRIVDALDAQFTRLASAVAALERIRANLKRYRAAVLKAACEGRLVPTEAELARREGRDYESADVLLQRILRERRARWEAEELERLKAKGKPPTDDRWKKKYKEPEPPDTTELPQLPEGWTWATPDQLASPEEHSLAIGPFGSNLKVDDYRESGVPLVFVRHIRAGQFEGLDDKFIDFDKALELRAHWVFPGDVLITKMGDPPGDTAVYPVGRPPAVITADCVRFLPSSLAGDPKFLAYAIRSPLVHAQILQATQGVAQKKISLARFRRIALPVPPLAEQRRIVDELERRFSIADKQELVIARNLQRATRARHAILHSAFTGRLVPQDPNDEPASVLLGRIRAQRNEQTELAIAESGT
ncbi:MAG TPA: restriction endonuclease subunit S [Longimicrobiales bacterium]